MFEVILSPEVEAFYAGADRPLARKLARCFTQFERDPRRHNNIKRLTGQLVGHWRFRVGDWRVIYRISGPQGIQELTWENWQVKAEAIVHDAEG